MHGASRLALEKVSLPRYGTCGGGISTRVLEQTPFSLESVIDLEVRSMSYALREQAAMMPLFGQSMRIVLRREFDACLLEPAEGCAGTTLCAVEEQRIG